MSVSNEIIRSSHNQIIKRIRSLGLRKHREAERAFVVEGRRIVETALESGADIEMILIVEDADSALAQLANSSGADWRLVERQIFDAAMDTVNPQGIAAIVGMTESVFPHRSDPFVVVLDGVSDPGNVGTIIRTAAAAGVDAVVVGPGSSDPYSPKAVRASMGSLLHIPILDANVPTVERLAEICSRRWLAAGDGDTLYSDSVWEGGVALIVGSEARGASEWGNALATGRVRIPIAREVESLNASIAAGVIVFEAHRQRTDCKIN
ncbi:RNA methyltransferase [soil metagenome]